MRSLLQDLRYAVRALRCGHSGMLLAAAVLAVAIGAVSVTYSVVAAVLLDSLPYRDPGRLVSARIATLDRRVDPTAGGTLSAETARLLLSPTGALESASYLRGAGQPVLTGLGEPVRVEGWAVAPDFFATLGAPALLGRTLVAGDAAVTGAVPVVVSHRFWRSRLGGASEAVGRQLTLDGRAHEVVGVMPPGFEFPADAQLWLPAEPLPTGASGQIQGGYWVVGRLAPGLSLLQARTRLDARFQAHAREFPAFETWGPNLAPLRELLTGEVKRPLLLLLGAVGLVLLLACANVAAVLLARGLARRRELAIRLAMGASHARIARQLLTESVLLALLAGAGGVLLAVWAVPALVSLAGTQLPRAAEISVDWRVLGMTLLVSTLAGVAAGLLPALAATREDVAAAISDGGAGTGNRSWRVRVGEGLVVVQVALGTLLLAGAGLLALSFITLSRVDYGFEPTRAVVAQVTLSAERYAEPARRAALVAEVLERARALPGVEAVSASDGIPFQAGAMGGVEVPGEEVSPRAPWAFFTGITPDHFRVLGMGLVRGRLLREDAEEPDAVLVNQAFARAFFPGRDPIGRTVVFFGEQRGRVVGVVSDARQQSLEEPPPAQIYYPLQAGEAKYLKIGIRTTGEPAAGIASLRAVIRSLDPLLPIDRIGALTDLASESVARRRFYAVALSSFALIALAITVLGMYGLASYTVSRRLRELGIRRALGASAAHIRCVTVGRTAVLAGVGVALGLLAAAATSRVLEALLFGLDATDPRVFGAVALLLASTAVAAAYPSARRASRVDPASVLRRD